MSAVDLKKRGLGRGLSALLPGNAPSANAATPQVTSAVAAQTPGTTPHPPAASDRQRHYFATGIENVYPGPEQPRRNFAEVELDELAASIRIHGIIMPLVVRPRPGADGYFLIAGERRWRAAQRAGLHEVPVIVQDVAPQAAFERALVENLQRADLSPIEEATAYQRLVDEFGLSHETIADRVGKDRSTVANAIRLLKLPSPVRQMVEEKQLSMGHARALLALTTPAAIEQNARVVVAKGLSVRATEALAKAATAPRKEPEANRGATATPPPGKSTSAKDLEQRLTKALGGPVTILEDRSGTSGAITLRYLDLDHLDRILDKLL